MYLPLLMYIFKDRNKRIIIENDGGKDPWQEQKRKPLAKIYIKIYFTSKQEHREKRLVIS